MKYQSKADLISDIHAQHDLLCARLDELPKSRCRKPGVWGDGWTVTDLVAHLSEWQLMFLRWYEDGLRGAAPKMPSPGYKWNETPKLNRAIWAKHRFRSAGAIRPTSTPVSIGFSKLLKLCRLNNCWRRVTFAGRKLSRDLSRPKYCESLSVRSESDQTLA